MLNIANNRTIKSCALPAALFLSLALAAVSLISCGISQPDEVKQTSISDLLDSGASPVFSSKSSCQGIIFQSIHFCDNSDCKAVIQKTGSLCRSGDCKALVYGNTAHCQTRDCRALLFRNIGMCQSINCRAILYHNAGICR